MKNLVVAKFIDGKIVKGHTHDFSSKSPIFHIYEKDDGNPEEIDFQKLKALFFVKSKEGMQDRLKSTAKTRKLYGKKVEVEFYDGEKITGYTQIYKPKDKGFFLFPDDEFSNNERIYVNKKATKNIRFI